MKILVYSDLHLEFGDFEPYQGPCDLVILAGDVHLGTKALPWIHKHFSEKGIPVAYVMGNHEFYKQRQDTLYQKLTSLAHAGVHILNRGALELKGVRILGATLWTDYCLYDDAYYAMFSAASGLSDHAKIRMGPSYRKFLPKDAVGLHLTDKGWLDKELAKPFDGKTIVVSHHAPSGKSIPHEFAYDVLSACYASNLEGFIAKHAIDYWIHGHVHTSLNYKVGDTTVLCNPRGYYGVELNDEFDPSLLLEL